MAKPFYKSLYLQVLFAIAIGVVLGLVAPDLAVKLKPLGDGFVKLVRMTIAPLIFCTVVVGIAGVSDLKQVGKAGGLALLYFEIASTIALAIGLVVVNVVKPGVGMKINLAKLDPQAIAEYTQPGKLKSTVEFLLDIIPDSLVGAFARGDLLPVLLLALLVGFALHATREHTRPVFDLIDQLGHLMFALVGMIMQLAPIGAFGAMAFTIGAYGVHTLEQLAAVMACFYATCLVFVLGVLGTVARVHGFSILRFLRYIGDEMLLVLGTSSSESALPRLMTKLEEAGAAKPVVGLVVPAGYSFNMDGTAIYLTIAAVFIAQATGTPLSLGDQLELLAVLLLTSKGAAGVSGGGFIVLAATLGAVGHVPVVGLAIILGIERFMSEARALTNFIGNGVATLVVARWCGALDRDKLTSALGGPRPEA